MMEKEFVPYELALRLKQLGFDEPCFGMYNKDEKLFIITPTNEKNFEYLLVPTFSQAFRWFRDEYCLHTYIGSRTTSDNKTLFIPNGRTIPDTVKNGFVVDNIVYTPCNSYEQSELACLDKLISIVEGIESQK